MDTELRNGPQPVDGNPTESEGPAIPRPFFALAVALGLGFVVEALLHGQPVGLGFALAGIVIVAGWLLAARGMAVRLSRSGLGLLAALLVISVLAAVRASPALRGLDVLACCALLLWIAGVALAGGLSSLGLLDHLGMLILSGLGMLLQPFGLLLNDLPRARRSEGKATTKGWHPIATGALLAGPLLLIFGALFAAADPVFAHYVRRVFDWDLDLGNILGRLFLSLVLSWLLAGLIRHALSPESRAMKRVPVNRPAWLRLGGTETLTILVLLNVLFLGFVLVQVVYLFGGADTLARTGLSHSEYARRGFFELVAVATLVLSLVLLLDWLVRPVALGVRRIVSGLHGSLVLLTLVILVSAFQRMGLYRVEYGLTELRLYTTAFMVWLAVILAWLIVTVLRGPFTPRKDGVQRQRFAFGGLILGLVFVGMLNLINPDAVIARTNLARAGSGVGEALDVDYLTRELSLDAVPALAGGLAQLTSPDLQKQLACGLIERQDRLQAQQDEESGWRGWTWGKYQAGRHFAAYADVLDAWTTACR